MPCAEIDTMPAAPLRAMGFWMCLALVMGNMIGSGVFMLPAAMAPYGWSAVIGWLATIAGVACLAVVVARLARALPEGGGPHGYTALAFGETTAFLVSWSYWVSIIVGNAAIATATISYLGLFAPALTATPAATAAATVALIGLLTLVNLAGARAAGAVQLVTTLLKVLPLVAVIAIILVVLANRQATIAAPGPISASGVNASASLAMFAMLGFECAAVASGRVRDPVRTVPRATIAGMMATGAIYMIVCSGIALMLPEAAVARSGAPFALFVDRYVGSGFALVIAGFAAVSAAGALNGWILAQGEVAVAMARRGGLPRWIGVTHRDVPARALIVSSAIGSALVLLNASRGTAGLFAFLALVSTASNLFLYLACAAAALRLRNLLQAGPRFLAIAALGVAFSVWTLVGAGEASVLGIALMAAGLPLYAWARRSAPAAPATEEAAVA